MDRPSLSHRSGWWGADDDELGPGEVAVELDDADGGGGDAASGSAPPERPGRPGGADGPGRHRGLARHRLAVVVAVVVLVLAVVVNVAERRAEGERRAVLRSSPGLVTTRLDVPPGVAWRLDLPIGGSAAGPLALVGEPHRADTPVRAVDLRTGRERWAVARSGAGGVTSCGGDPAAAEPEVVVCWTRGVRDDPSTQRLLVLDADDGTERGRLVEPVPTVGWAVVGTDAVLAERTGGRLTVRRLDLLSGAQRWDVEVDLQLRLVDGSYRARLVVEHGFVVVQGPTTLVLDATSGAVLGEWRTPDEDDRGVISTRDGADVVTTPDGFGVWEEVRRGRRSPAGTWHDRRGTVVSRLPGVLAEPPVSDGSTPGVAAVLVEGRLVGVDLASGASRWSVAMAGAVPLVRTTGTLVLARGADVLGVDLTTGSTLWSTTVPDLRVDAGWVSDGQQVLLASLDGPTWVLRAVALDGAGVLWTAPSPGRLTAGPTRLGGVGGLQAHGGAVVLVAPDGLTGLH